MRFLGILSLTVLAPSSLSAAEYDVVVYGGTSAGVAAAIQTARMGKSVVLIEPSWHLGGLTTGGLGWTDSGNKEVIGGIAREFYQRLKKHYDDPKSWVHEKPEQYPFYRPKEDAIWAFEPKVAEQVLLQMLKEHKVVVHVNERLLRSRGVKLDGKRIVSITLHSGKSFDGMMFIDATYEGDLLAVANVSHVVGREPLTKYGETMNGVARKWQTHTHRFTVKVDPFVKPGDPKSGLLFGIDPGPYPEDGQGDERLQAYCFRMCMSNVAANRVPFPKPADYDEAKYELLFRNFEAGDTRLPLKIDRLPNGKTDTNNNYAVSTDFIGQNYTYPNADYTERMKIIMAHESYQKGLMWSLANHPRVPQKIRDQMKPWGLAADEFTNDGNWPHQIYVREARRMVSDYVQTEQDCRRKRQTPESVGMGSYNMDSHNCMRWVTPDGTVQNEGDVQEGTGGPYKISYRSLVPKRGECPNLLVPVCVSSSHIAYGSIRMEPVFFILGQSAATAGVIAIDEKIDAQAVDYEKLKKRLLADKQVLEYSGPTNTGGIDIKTLNGIAVDDEDAVRIGFTTTSTSVGPYIGSGYRHDGNAKDGKHTAKFVPDLPAAGKYEVRISYTANPNRATNVPVTINHADGATAVKVNQQQKPPISELFISVGTFKFEKGKTGNVLISNDGTDGYVVIDAVQFVPAK